MFYRFHGRRVKKKVRGGGKAARTPHRGFRTFRIGPASIDASRRRRPIKIRLEDGCKGYYPRTEVRVYTPRGVPASMGFNRGEAERASPLGRAQASAAWWKKRTRKQGMSARRYVGLVIRNQIVRPRSLELIPPKEVEVSGERS